MSKFKISYISDCIFVFGLSFLICYAPLYFFVKKRLPSAIISFFASVIALTLFIFVSRKRTGLLAIKKSEEKQFSDCRNAFLISDDKTINDTMLRLLKKLKNQARPIKNGFALPKNEFAFYKFSAKPLGADEIINAYKSSPKGALVIFFGICFDESARDFAKNLGLRIKLVDFTELFLLLKDNDCVLSASEVLTEGEKKVSRKRRFISAVIDAFDKKKAKTFAFYGATTLFLSRFVAYPIYYTIIGCVFLIYAVIIKFFAPRVKDGSL